MSSDQQQAGTADPEAAALISEIRLTAQSQREQILMEARGRARTILEAAEEKITSADAEAAKRMEKLARVDADRLLGQVILEAAAERLRARRQMYQKAVDSARARLEALARGPGAPAALRALIAEALEKVPGNVQLTVSRADLAACTQAVRELGKNCSVTAGEFAPGSIVVAAEDGRRKADNSLEVRLARAADSMEALIAARLFGQE